jgi:hypothetical protein
MIKFSPGSPEACAENSDIPGAQGEANGADAITDLPDAVEAWFGGAMSGIGCDDPGGIRKYGHSLSKIHAMFGEIQAVFWSSHSKVTFDTVQPNSN